MRRIDLFCKLTGPLAISVVDGLSSRGAIVGAGALTLFSLPVEYFAIAKVYKAVDDLRMPKQTDEDNTTRTRKAKLRAQLEHIHRSVRSYIKHQAFLPSFSLALLYLTVLSFNGQMIAYLVALGIGSSTIGVLRGVSALFEMSATWIAPRVMDRIGTLRAGIWFLNWQLLCVAAASTMLWLGGASTAAAAGLVFAVVASRVGLWGFDLSAQMIVQEVGCSASCDCGATANAAHRKSSRIYEARSQLRSSRCKTSLRCCRLQAP